jgi:hypothetical protein
MAALDSITPRAPKLLDKLGQAIDLAESARTSCAAGDPRTARKLLKGSSRKLGRLRKLLAAKASKVIPNRSELIVTAKGLRTDVRSLRATLTCPNDAASGG